jgi:endonuclease/exonuclease/phosphatase family metal-dependent hydrolase
MAPGKEKKRRNTFFQGFGKLIIGICGIAALISAFLCAICPFISPSSFVWTAFFGLAFWMIFFANVIILLILIFLKSRRTLLIPILALILSIPGLAKSYSLGEKNEDTASIKVMTYNIGVFRDYKVNSRTVTDVKKSLAKLVKEQNPDVICLQESGKWPQNRASEFSKMIGYKYYSVNPVNGNSFFSKFPIEDVKGFNNETISKYADIKKVKIDKDESFYLVNCHFNSFGISNEEIEYINDAKNIVKDKEIYGKSVITKLTRGFKLRTKSTQVLIDKLPDDDTPLVICGDFNDTPLSYTYNQMSKAGLKDAFLAVSKGIGKTYCGRLPLLRIDYFWYNDNIEIVDYNRIKQTTSDHYPLLMSFNIKKETENLGEE